MLLQYCSVTKYKNKTPISKTQSIVKDIHDMNYEWILDNLIELEKVTDGQATCKINKDYKMKINTCTEH